MQVLVRVKTKFPAQGGLVPEIAVELRPQKIHHHRAGHGGVLCLHAVVLQPFGGTLAPAGLDAALGVAVHVEPVALLLGVGQHLLPVQVDDLVAAADVVVDMAVDGLVVIHAAGHQHFRLAAMRLLVVEDEPELNRLLRRNGWRRPTTAWMPALSGTDALDYPARGGVRRPGAGCDAAGHQRAGGAAPDAQRQKRHAGACCSPPGGRASRTG